MTASKLLTLAALIAACASCKKANQSETLLSYDKHKPYLVRVDISHIPQSVDVSEGPQQLCAFGIFSDSSIRVTVPHAADSIQKRIFSYCSGAPLTQYKIARSK